VLDQALMFIESMGFLMTDLDIPLLGEADREMLWASLPLQNGAPGAGETVPATPAAGAPLPSSERKPAVAPPAVAAPTPPPLPKAEAPRPAPASPPPESPPVPAHVPPPPEPSGVDDLLAAVEALRTRRPETRNRRKPPGREELQRRRRDLTASLGRILASL
jgi:hypothetical protein